jgi:miniconductance mechanosensitive channel
MDHLRDLLSEKLGFTINHWLISGVELISYSLLIMIVYYIFKKNVLTRVRDRIKDSKWSFGNYLIKHSLFTRTFALIPVAALSIMSLEVLNEKVASIGAIVSSSLMCIFVVLLIFSFLNALVDMANNKGFKKLPLKPISQIIKIIVSILGVIVVYSKLIDESPSSILAGLGALSAVSMLVFQDTLKSLVASFLITSYDSVSVNDWIEVKSLGIDGDVLEINLNIIKIKNFDNTISTIPTHFLMSTSYKNYKNMYSSGRRIKKSINFDINSFRNLDNDDIEELSKIKVIKNYLSDKNLLIDDKSSGLSDIGVLLNERVLTNIGTFRKYMYYYLKNHADICNENILLIRQLDNIGEGLPIEIYCFTHNSAWIHNEDVASDIFDHFYTVASSFGLKVYQRPTGGDLSLLINRGN